MIRKYDDNKALCNDLLTMLVEYCPDSARLTTNYYNKLFGSEMEIRIRLIKDK